MLAPSARRERETNKNQVRPRSAPSTLISGATGGGGPPKTNVVKIVAGLADSISENVGTNDGRYPGTVAIAGSLYPGVFRVLAGLSNTLGMLHKSYRIKKRQRCPLKFTELKSVKDASSYAFSFGGKGTTTHLHESPQSPS